MDDLIIVGAGGFGLEVAAYAKDMGRFAIKGFLDDTKKAGTKHGEHSVLGATDSALAPNTLYIIAVGLPEGRKALSEKLASKGAKFATIIHPQSYVAASAKIGAGSIITPFAFVGPEAQIGKQCLLNVHASVGHESRIGDYCVLSPYAGTHGEAVLGAGVFMGSNAYVTAKQKVGDRSKIAAGSIVYNDVPADARVMGNPAQHKPL